MNFSRPSVGFYSFIAFNQNIATRNGFNFLNIDEVLKDTIKIVFTNFEGFPMLKFDAIIFTVNDFVAIELLNREISIRRKKILGLLTSAIDNGELTTLCGISDSEIEVILTNVDMLPALKKVVREALNPILLSDDYALCGKNLLLDLPRSYIIANKDENPEALLKRAIERRELFQTIEDNQEFLSIPRNSFNWIANPFLVPIRQIYKEKINKIAAIHQFTFSEFDLSMQLLMHLAAYKIDDVWDIPDIFKIQISGLDQMEEVCDKFSNMIKSGSVTPNDTLIMSELSRLADELDIYFSRLHVKIKNIHVKLPSSKMCDMNSSPFTDFDMHTELITTNREYIDIHGDVGMVVHEKLSRKRIIFSSISPEISSLYSRGFCNLHYANPGEIAVYGAFVEGEKLPFAYSSYGKISYRYTKEMLLYLGFADGEIVESSRAWNAVWAPENTMSVLFSYAQDRLKERFGNEIRGILTSINPNLGFSASAFRGIHFDVVSLKPTIFSYQLIDGKPYFRSKSEIAKNLGMSTSSLHTSEYYTNNKIPFLPTIEFLYLYDKDERRCLSKSPIYVVTENDYLYNR